VSSPPQLVINDLARSGLAFDPDTMRAANPHTDPALVAVVAPQLDVKEADAILTFQYYRFNEDGTLRPLPLGDFARTRVYWKPRTGFDALATKDPRPKYLQQPGTPVELYIPPTLDWTEYFKEDHYPLIVTEGEKKALAIAQRGLYAVGLGGVSSVAPGKKKGGRDMELLPDLARAAAGRIVYVVFDIDAGYRGLKPEVSTAARRLCSRLVLANAKPRVCILQRNPNVDVATKWAVDDFLVANPDMDAEEFHRRVHHDSEADASAEKLLSIDAKYVYVRDLHAIGDRKTRSFHAKDNFLTIANTDQVAMTELTITREGLHTFRERAMPLGNGWLQWRGRSEVRTADYRPGCESEIAPDGVFNRWKGWGQAPDADADLEDIERFRDGLMLLHGEEDWYHMFLWYMYPLAFPEINKQYVVPVLQSEAEGVGKSFFPEMVGMHCYGPDNYTSISEGNIDDRMEFVGERMFVQLDDVNSLKMQQAKLNSIITNKTLRVNEKYVRSRDVANRINIVITTNHTNPLRITEDTRRFFFPEIIGRKDPSYWNALREWFEGGGGGKLIGVARKMRAWGVFADYDPRAAAPVNARHHELEELSVTEADRWTEKSFVQQAVRDIVTFNEACAAFQALMQAQGARPVEYATSVFKRAVNLWTRDNEHAKRVLSARKDGKRVNITAYCVRNIERWGGEDDMAWKKEIDTKPHAYRGNIPKNY